MRVKMLTTMAGPRGAVEAGEVTELPGPFAQELLRAGFAERVSGAVALPPEPDPPAETATIEPPQNAAHRTRRPRGRR